MKKELTKEMQKQVDSWRDNDGDDCHGCHLGGLIEAMKAVAKEAKMELIKEVKEIVWNDRKKALDLLTTLEEDLNQE